MYLVEMGSTILMVRAAAAWGFTYVTDMPFSAILFTCWYLQLVFDDVSFTTAIKETVATA